MRRVAILGAGGMGTALALLIGKSGADVNVRLWCRDPEHAGQMARGRVNVRHLPEVVIPDAIEITDKAADAVAWSRSDRGRDSNLVSEGGIDQDCRGGAREGPRAECCQGHRVRNLRATEPDHQGNGRLTIRLGLERAQPCRGAGRGLPASVVVSGASDDLNDRIRDLLNHQTFRVYTSSDALGVELAGALKNILGIAAGICDGLGFGDNAKAALLTRGLVEIARLGVELGGKRADLLRARGGRRRGNHLLQPLWTQSFSGRADRPGGDSRADPGRHGQCGRGRSDNPQRLLACAPAGRGDAHHHRALPGLVREKAPSLRRCQLDGPSSQGRVGMVSLPPESCNIAFKEWSGVCDALIQGRQTVILRKGGISEGAGPGQFAPEHTEFWLYPTWTHQSQQGLRSLGEQTAKPLATAPNPDGSIPIRGFVRLGLVGYVKSEDALPALRPFHCLEDETILKRFHYRKPGLWVLAARVWRQDPGFLRVSDPRTRWLHDVGHSRTSLCRPPGLHPSSTIRNGPSNADRIEVHPEPASTRRGLA